MQWDSKLELGIESVDNQHKTIIERIHRLEIALDSQATSVSYQRMIETHDFLHYYVAAHFREEEEMMAQGNYPELEAHKDRHRSFEMQLAQLRIDLDNSGLMSHAAAQLINYLSKWFITHIQTEDPKYALYLNSCNIRARRLLPTASPANAGVADNVISKKHGLESSPHI
jgi:hemerythrin